ncbi:MAG: Ig-like domain-containing protein, partial [Bifidobacteriaceae bacterium]|nr:Ig-like domain-containing protein [Bifidobacteriaceae bacterium]
ETVTALPAPASTTTVTAAPNPNLNPNAAAATSVVRLKASQTRVTLVKGHSERLVARAYLANGTAAKGMWKSLTKSVATVSANGTIKARRTGTAYLVVFSGSKAVKIKATVVARSKARHVKRVAAHFTDRTLAVGQTAYVTGRYAPAAATSAKVRYTSSDPAVVSVDKAGRLLAKAPGRAKITVKAGTKSKRYTVKVA